MKKKLVVIGFLFTLNYSMASDYVTMPRDQAIEELSIAVSKLIEENKELKKALEIKSKSDNSNIKSDLTESSYVIFSPMANIYKTESVNSTVVKRYEAGELFSAKEVHSDWLYIRNIGYVKNDDVKKLVSLDLNRITVKQTKNLRVKPYIREDSVVGKATRGQEIVVYDFPINKNWYLTKEGNFIYKPRN